MTRAKDISKILTDADISGNIDVDGVTNLDVVDIDGALTQDGGAVFNEASADVDFRVEGNTDTHALFVQGGSNHVGINNTSPNSQLTGADNLVVGNTGVATSGMTFVGSGGSGSQALIHFSDATSGTARYDGFIGYEHTDRFMKFGTAQAEQVRIHSNGVLSASDGIALGVGTANTASNVISDYEEGSFTPTWDGYTAYSTSGKYVKIGTQVTVYVTLVTNSGTDESLIQINNLPFQVAGNQGGGMVDHNGLGLYAYNINTKFTNNSTICKLFVSSGGAEVGIKYVSGSQPTLGGFSSLIWTLVYQST